MANVKFSQIAQLGGNPASGDFVLMTTSSNTTDSLVTVAELFATITGISGTWSAAQTFDSGNFKLAGSGSGTTTLNASATASGTLTFPAATDTLVGRATTDTLTNKTLASTTDVIGGVTMTLGSDATGDVYYRNNSGVLTRLAAGASGQILGVSGGLPAWSNAGRPTVLSGNTTYYVRTVPANCTISNASPAVVSLTAHGLSVNDPVVFCTPNNRTSGITVTLASPGAFTWTAHGLSAGFPVVFNSTGLLPTGLTAGTTYYVTNNAALTTNGFNVSDTQAHALAGTNTVNTSGSQSGTHWGNWAGVAPTGVTFGTIYYVISSGFGANSFEFSTSQGGSAVNTSSASVGQMQAQTGNDANPGTAQTRTGAWLTSAHAELFLAQNVDLAGFIATIQYAAGYYDGISIRHQWFSSIADYNDSLEASAYFVGVDQLGNTILQDNVAANTGSISINSYTDINQVQFYFNNVECRPTLDACVHAAYDENANLTAMAHLGQPSGAGGTLYYNGSGTDKLLNGAIIDDQSNTTHVVVGLGSAVKFWQISGAVTGIQPSLLGNLTLLNQPNFSTAFIYCSNQGFGEYLIPLTGTTTGTLASSPTIYFCIEGSEFRHPGNSQTWTAFGLSGTTSPLPTSTQRNGRFYNYSDTPYSIQDIGTSVAKSGPLTLSNGLNSNVDWSSGDVGGMGVVYISGPTGAFSIGGWQKYLAGLTFKIYNTTSQTMTIVHEDASSTTNYRIHTTTAANVAVTGPGWAEFWYDNSVKRWILVNASQPSGSGGGGSPASPSGSLQYDNSGSFGAVPSYCNGSSILALGNTTTAQQLLVYNTVDTISGPTNYECGTFDFTTTANVLSVGTQFGGSGTARDLALIGSSGRIQIVGGSSTDPILVFCRTTGGQNVQLASIANGGALRVQSYAFGGNDGPQFGGAGNVTILSTSTYGFQSNNSFGTGHIDTALYRGSAAGILALANTNSLTSACGLQVFNTVDTPTGPTNYERGIIDWTTTTNVLTIGPQAGGTGTLRYMQQTTAFASNPPTTKTGNYAQTLGDQDLIFNGSASITLTLLSASTYPGLTLWVRTIAGFTVVSASSNVVPLAGGAAGTAILAATAGKWAKLVSDGTNWQIQASN